MSARRHAARAALRAEDLQRLGDAALELHAAETLAELRQATPAAFRRAVAADFFVMSEFTIDRAQRRVRMVEAWESRPHLTPEMAAGHEHILYDHPFTRHALRHRVRAPMLLSDFMTTSALRRSALYRNLLAPAGFLHVMGTVTPSSRGIETLTYARGPAAPPFEERDRAVFAMLRAHFVQVRERVERAARVSPNLQPPVAGYGLTPRELEIARWLSRGLGNSEIARATRIQVRTVEKHLERIYAKLGVENRTTAALLLATSPGL